MLVKMTSTNPNFISILQKNPDSFDGIQLRSIKNGVGIGKVVSPNEYHLVFQDTKYSFSEDASNQIDFLSYCSPRAFLSMSSIFLRHVLVEADKWNQIFLPWLDKAMSVLDTEGEFQNELVIENIYADGFNHKRGFVLSKYFQEISLDKKSGELFRLTIKTNRSIHYMINLACLCCMYIASTNQQPWYLDHGLASKYIRIMRNIKPVPYFVLHLFARNCLPSKEIFDQLKPELEAIYDGKLQMEFGGSQRVRIKKVDEILLGESGKIEHDIIEIGCGEMDYPRAFLSKLGQENTWWACDKTDYNHFAENIRKKYNRDNLKFCRSVDEIDTTNPSIMMLIEVIEHMEYEESKSFLASALNKFKPGKVIITTPNFAFNTLFMIEGYRHDDHKFELNESEFKEYIEQVISSAEGYVAEYFGIGDVVDGESMTLGAILKKSMK